MDERVNLTDLIHRAEKGDAEASDRLFAETYADLRKLARRRLMRDRRTSLDTAALAHESYLRFAASGRLHLEDRVHFIRWAGEVMRSVIVDFARRRSAARRGGKTLHVTLTTGLADGHVGNVEEILGVHEPDCRIRCASRQGRRAALLRRPDRTRNRAGARSHGPNRTA